MELKFQANWRESCVYTLPASVLGELELLPNSPAYSQPGHLRIAEDFKAGLCPGKCVNTQCALKAPEERTAGLGHGRKYVCGLSHKGSALWPQMHASPSEAP